MSEELTKIANQLIKELYDTGLIKDHGPECTEEVAEVIKPYLLKAFNAPRGRIDT